MIGMIKTCLQQAEIMLDQGLGMIMLTLAQCTRMNDHPAQQVIHDKPFQRNA